MKKELYLKGDEIIRVFSVPALLFK